RESQGDGGARDVALVLAENPGDVVRLESGARAAQRTLGVLSFGVLFSGGRLGCGHHGSMDAAGLCVIRWHTIVERALRAQASRKMLGSDACACTRQRHRALDFIAKL